MSIAAAIRWALDSNLQGLVLDSGAVQEQSQAVATARSKGLKVSLPSSTATALSGHSIAPLPGLNAAIVALLTRQSVTGIDSPHDSHTQLKEQIAIRVGDDGSVQNVMDGLPCRC